MNRYQALYLGKPNAADIQNAKEFLIKNETAAWEDYYWCAKMLCAHDTDNFEAEPIIGALNLSIKLGLSYRANRELYLDAIKILATLNEQLCRHEIVLNYLSSILELDDSAPDWIYHDFISAQIHTDAIRRILRRPRMFLEDLSRNDHTDDLVAEKQRSIFKEFLVEAVKYVYNNPGCPVDRRALADAASAYGLLNSDGWRAFESACASKPSSRAERLSAENIPIAVGSQVALSNSTRPLIVSLFPEDSIPSQEDNSAIENEHAELLSELDKARDSLEQTRQALEMQNEILSSLQKERDELMASAQEESTEQKRLQGEIDKASAENEALRVKIKALEDTQTAKLGEMPHDAFAIIISHMHIYLHTTQLKLVEWLEHNLSKCADDWWESCVIESLSYEQRERAHERHFVSLNQFDLAALLRVMNKNWYNFRSITYLNDADRDCLQKMFGIRNKWAHMDINLPDKAEIKDDFYTIADFMTQIRCSKDTIKEVNEFARDVGKILA